MSRILFLFISFNVYCSLLTGQDINFIDNPSFEEFYDDNGVEIPLNWIFTNSVDYFSTNKIQDAGEIFSTAPTNYAGYQRAQDGVAYVGFAFLYPEFGFREYISTKLMFPLEKDSRYCIEFYISLSDSSKYNSNSISFWFSDKIEQLVRKNRLVIESDNFIILDDLGVNKEEWLKVSYIYIADGFEKYFTIGNCLNCTSKKKYKNIIENRKEGKRTKFDNKYSVYYYLDNVSVKKLYPSSLPNDKE